MGLPSTAELSVASAGKRRLTFIVWILVLVAAAAATALWLSTSTTTEVEFLIETESINAENLLSERMGYETPLTEQLVLTSESLTVDDPAFQEVIISTTESVRGLDEFVAENGVFNYLEAADSDDPQIAAQAESLVSEDRMSTLIPVTLAGDLDESRKYLDEYLETIAAQSTDTVDVLAVGDLSTDEAFSTIAEEDLVKGETIGIIIGFIILLLIFRTLVAAFIPLGLAILSIAIAIGSAAVIGQAWTLSFFITNMITMIGLAVGIDYALFVIERYREERRRGWDKMEAIAIAGGTASKAVLFSGLTVIFALLGLMIVPNSIFRSLGLGAILVVTVAVLAVLTLVPAVIHLLGNKLEWPRKNVYSDASRAKQVAYDLETMHSGFWGRITKVVMAHPVPALVLSAGLLIALTIPYFDMKTGFAGVESLPESDVKTAYTILSEDFSAGRLAPVDIVLDAPQSAELDQRIAEFSQELSADSRVTQVLPVTWNDATDLAHLQLFLSTGPNEPATIDAITALRTEILPTAFNPVGVDPLVGGITAFNMDFFELAETWQPYVFAFVLTLSFILLMMAFRSIVVPLKAIIMNLLSVGAAYGVLVLVFQKGYGADLLGFQEAPTIEAWIPIFLFSVLFGLSMDYQVFLLSRIREHYDLTHNNTESVAYGLQATGRIITGAALIMVAVFLGFASSRLVFLQQMGFGLAVAILLDATIVRCVLVPATMRLLGDWNWYLPSWLSWLPDLRVEGSPDEILKPAAAD